MYEKPRKYTKMIASAIVGASTFFVTRQVLENNIPEQDGKIRKIETAIGSAVIGTIVTDYTKDWTNRKVDALFDAFDWSVDDTDLEPLEA